MFNVSVLQIGLVLKSGKVMENVNIK